MDENGRRNERIIAITLVGFSVLYLVTSFRLEIGSMRNPGPGFLPVWIGIFSTACTGLYLLRVTRKKAFRREAGKESAGERKNYRAIAGIIACGLVYPLILETFKFLVSTFVVTFFMLYLLKPRQPVFSIFLSLAIAIVFFLTFSRLLGVGLPMGAIEIFLFHIGG
jgi:putative tricarboxylic transport membrane protein